MTEQMQCLEVWGGNRSVEQHFRMPGLEVWLYSQPYDDAASGGGWRRLLGVDAMIREGPRPSGCRMF